MQEVFEKIKQKLEEELKISYELVKKAIEGNSSQADFPKGYMSGIRNALFIVDQVAEEYNNGWIPCSDRLPSEKEAWNYIEEVDLYEPNEFIVMIKGATLPTVLFYDSISNEWSDGDDDVYEVIAWQPLPAPYKKEV